MKIVLDTNILVSGIFWVGVPAKLLEYWHKDKVQVLASEPILAEYLQTIQKLALRIDRPDIFKRWALVLDRKSVV